MKRATTVAGGLIFGAIIVLLGQWAWRKMDAPLTKGVRAEFVEVRAVSPDRREVEVQGGGERYTASVEDDELMDLEPGERVWTLCQERYLMPQRCVVTRRDDGKLEPWEPAGGTIVEPLAEGRTTRGGVPCPPLTRILRVSWTGSRRAESLQFQHPDGRWETAKDCTGPLRTEFHELRIYGGDRAGQHGRYLEAWCEGEDRETRAEYFRLPSCPEEE